MQIRSERGAVDYLFKCWGDPDFGNDEPLALETCALNLRLDPGDGKANWKTIRAVNLLQQHLNLTYLLAKRGTLTGRVSDHERELLSLAVTVGAGSTLLSIETVKALRAIYKVLPAHWSTRTRNITIAGICAAVLAVPVGHEYASYRTEIDKAAISAAATERVSDNANAAQVRIAEIQAKAQVAVADVQALASITLASAKADSNGGAPKLALGTSGFSEATPFILARLVRDDRSNLLAFAVSDYVPWRPALMDLAPNGGTIQWNGVRPLPAAAAKAIAKSARKIATEQRRIAKANGHPGLIDTPWVTEVLRSHSAPGAMRLGTSDA